MRKVLHGIFSVVMFLSLVNVAYGAFDEFVEGMNGKLSRGAINAVTGALEFPAEIVRGYERGLIGSKPLGAISGVLSGVWSFAGRFISGVADLATFWAADPEDNIGIGIHLENKYAWEGVIEPSEALDLNDTEGALISIGKKLVRGSLNLVGGILEVPVQIKKSIPEGNIASGIAKGLWFWLSREASGVYDIVTLLLPTPEDNLGVSFDEN